MQYHPLTKALPCTAEYDTEVAQDAKVKTLL